jgi:hypothetical protein
VSFNTNRYSAPFHLIGQTVELQVRDGQLTIYHHGRCVAEHPLLEGHYQLRILPEHGPGAIARNTRQRYGLAGAVSIPPYPGEVEVRDLTLYEQLVTTTTAAEVTT